MSQGQSFLFQEASEPQAPVGVVSVGAVPLLSSSEVLSLEAAL